MAPQAPKRRRAVSRAPQQDEIGFARQVADRQCGLHVVVRLDLGPSAKAEHDRLRKRQPSYLDHYQLIDIELDVISEWMLFRGDDIAAHVKRMSDNKPFILGLAEL